MKLRKMTTSVYFSSVAAGLLMLGALLPVHSQAANDGLSMDQLLNEVRQGRTKDAATNKKREAAFLAEKAKQEKRIRDAMAKVAALEAKSAKLEAEFNANELLVEKNP